MLDDQFKACAFIPVMHISPPSPSPPCFLELSWAVLPCTNMQAYERLIRPALEGVENVLTTALSISSLEKVVLTSSVAAVAGSKTKLPADYVYSEADWNYVATDTYLPYNRSALRRHQGCSLNTIQDKFWKRQGRFRSFCIVQKSRSPAFWGPKGFYFLGYSAVCNAYAVQLGWQGRFSLIEVDMIPSHWTTVTPLLIAEARL